MVAIAITAAVWTTQKYLLKFANSIYRQTKGFNRFSLHDICDDLYFYWSLILFYFSDQRINRPSTENRKDFINRHSKTQNSLWNEIIVVNLKKIYISHNKFVPFEMFFFSFLSHLIQRVKWATCIVFSWSPLSIYTV